MEDFLENRMKKFEKCFSGQYLIPRMPVIIRLDGKAFHTFTKHLKKPYDEDLMNAFKYTMLDLCGEVQNCKLAYTQSDEISLLLTDYETFETEQWFGGNIQKIVSVTASMCTRFFSKYSVTYRRDVNMIDAFFDCRVFSLPKEEVCNYFIWRQKDCERNSINSLGQKYFSHKELQEKNINYVKQMLLEQKDVCWEKEITSFRRGTCVAKVKDHWVIDYVIPIFTEDRNYIEKFVENNNEAKIKIGEVD